MGQRFAALNEEHIAFIEAQKMFVVGTALAEGHVNVSPKGMDALRVLGSQRLVWLNLTGSGNETAAHVQRQPRLTLMFCAFEGKPQILRVYGSAREVQRGDAAWEELAALFPPLPGARQLFDVAIELVQTSCGMAVPRYAFLEKRQDLSRWARKQGEDGLRRYWSSRNARSLDGLPTAIGRQE
ncbi:pyridoxamine 5'-phosphate oxidase family protein [Synechococcus sp. CBW1107]|uniref:pyridoxamine 5'-phosphate oxidase family protein n=1 Tax=Synechococcus sp. CBW1107 TaxID=2789857 RepID=UPI0018CEA39D|nr:pyridoxamine 5'-phosphate oxidase family protein [Synechococcus sp. CBW1107]QPN57746.1 pyridoxamine 5'-phosphate oxidase family protein [Synechococcus sp. CBW1107]